MEYSSPVHGKRGCLPEQGLLTLIDNFLHIAYPRLQLFGRLRFRIGVTGHFQILQGLGIIALQRIPVADVFGYFQGMAGRRSRFSSICKASSRLARIFSGEKEPACFL